MNGVGITDRRSDGARVAKSSPARFPTNVIGPLLREGTLAIACSCRTLVVRSLNGDCGIGGGVIGDVVDDGGDGVVGDSVGVDVGDSVGGCVGGGVGESVGVGVSISVDGYLVFDVVVRWHRCVCVCVCPCRCLCDGVVARRRRRVSAASVAA